MNKVSAYLLTFCTSWVGTTAFAIAMGESWRTAIAAGIASACGSVTGHRLLIGMQS